MEVSPNSGTGPVGPIGRPRVTPRAVSTGDSVSLQHAEAVSRAVQSAPDVRPAVVDRAAGLISNVKYPPMETIRAFSHLLALSLDEQQS